MGNIRIDDEAQLEHFGYKQELLRALGGFSNFAIAFSVISILTGGITLYGYGLTTAGPKGIVLGWIIVSAGTVFIALAMAELASAFPTAGALYHWATFLGNKPLGWFTAWFNYLGQFAITAGIDYGLAEFVTSLCGGSLDGNTKLYVYGLIILSHALVNHYGIRWVARFNIVSAWYHLAGVVVLVGVLLAFAPLQPPSFLLTESTTTANPYPLAFLLGLLLGQWTLTGYDASAHVSEETMHVSEKVPWGILISVLSSAVLGFVMLVVITLSVGDLGSAQKAVNPFIHIMITALGSGLGQAMVWLCVIAMWFCGLSSLTSNSRMLYAFARDGGVPFHRIFARVSPTHLTPAPAIWISVILAFLLVFYGKGFTAVVTISAVLILISYLMPILIAFIAQARGRWHESRKGVFRLGRASLFCQGAASLWMIFMIGLLLYPYDSVVFHGTAGVTVALVILYFGVAKKRFRGVQVAVPT